MKWASLCLSLLLGWFAFSVETLVIVEEPTAAKAVDMIRTGALDFYAAGVADPTILEQIRQAPNVLCFPTYNVVWHLSFNPAGPLFQDGRLNPFADPRAREAMNWLLDRDYIVQEFLGGAGLPQILPLRPVFPDYARLAQYARPLELRYQHDPERGRLALSAVLESLGAEYVEGKWVYQGRPVEIRLLIRTDARRAVGDYVATLLEGLGFVVARTYATYAEALRILSAPPEEGLWHIYTNALVVSLIERDEASTFQLNYTPVFPTPPWQYLRPSPELASVSERLARGDYTSLAEREALMAQALALAMEDSGQVWLAVRSACYPHSSELNLALDLAAGIATGIWAHTISAPRDTVRIGIPRLFSAPLNPVAGSFTIYDQALLRAVGDVPLIPHPYNGLYLPMDLVRAEVEVAEGVPIQKSMDWVEVRTVPKIVVPKEAWVDWDPEGARFLTVAELHPQGLSVNTRVVLRFRSDLWEKTWHDGTRFSPADFLSRFILAFDRAKKQSPVYDESAVPAYENLMAHFRGLCVKSFDPLVVEVYTDLRVLDAEWLAAKAVTLFYPFYDTGPGPWHVLALLLRAEAEGKLALSRSKAQTKKAEWANLLAGPSLAILAETLKIAQEEAFVPYANFLGRFVSEEEARERYAALARFHEAYGHFFVGNGPFYVELVKPVEKVLVLQRWPEYKGPVENLARLGKPPMPWVEIRGPTVVSTSFGATYTIRVGCNEELLGAKDVEFVKYLLFDGADNLVDWGFAFSTPEGFRVEIKPEVLGVLGSMGRLEVVAALKEVALAAWARLGLTVVGPGG